ncbi:TonB-dependent receptor [Qipengyuania sphaerica]|uniref:TonB-dependent receptor n=1 Tax=Qipengyuania sphaerica TaxID=2867243 RepID=UPI001C88AC11|nr:TonB-dependent receptor [Qipengyuania sphaerica]MBX7540043.1 TonB-dependent receptor [Qipengyuania sphaerica]
MAIRSKLAATVSMSAFAAALGTFAAPAAAQESAEGTPAEATADDDVIVVTGFRASLQSATAEKKRSATIVESVKAEDIGKLPDNSIGESIARLPGIAAQRSNGRANIISIRGFGPDFSTTTLNGRQQTTTNDSRAVEFDQFPSEILSGVDVYKTSQANRTAGGLVGAIDLRTIRPLDISEPVIAVGARGVYNDLQAVAGSREYGFRVFGTFVDTFGDDNIGVALSAAYTDEPYHIRDWNAWGYGAYDADNEVFGISGVKTWEESSRLKRLGLNGTVQARLGDQLTLTVDGFYSNFDEKLDQKGFEMPILCCGSTVTGFTSRELTGPVSGASIVTSATWTGRPIIENYATDAVNDTYSVGGNLEWENDNGLRAMLDVSWSRTDRWQDRLETIAGLGRNLPTEDDLGNPLPVETFGGTFGYTLTEDNALLFTSDFNANSDDLVLTDVQGWSGPTNQAGYDKIRESRDDLKQIRAEIEKDLGGLFESLLVGVDYVTRNKRLTQQEATLIPPGGADFAVIPDSVLVETTFLDRGFGEILSYDPRLLVPQGILDYEPNDFGASQAYEVTEDVWTPFAMLNFFSDLGGGTDLTGNIGIQAVHTSVESVGAVKPTITDEYWMILPSLNLNFRAPEDFVIRFGASRQFMRPRLPQMNNIVDFGVNINLDPQVYDGGGGNPTLRPYMATALDLSVEKYFGTQGYIALQLYWKNLDQYIDPDAIDTAFDYSVFPVPTGIVPATPIGIYRGPVNTEGGYIMGGELAGTLPFDVFTTALDGFGLTGGVGYTDTKAEDFNGNATDIPGYSKWVANMTAFYDKGEGFSARASMRYRSDFIGDFSLFSGGLDRQSVLAETVYDAQIGYDFADGSTLEGLSLFIQGQNLTDERQATVAPVNGQGIPEAWLKYQTYGRRFLAGFTYKF